MRWVIPASFISIVAALVFIKPPICLAIYLGLLIYVAYLPAGRLASWQWEKTFPLAFLPYLLALIAAAGVAEAIPPVKTELEKTQQAQAQFFNAAAGCPLGLYLVAIQVLALAPLVEEVVFRGLLFEEIRKRAGVVAGYILSSGLFALLHSPGPGALPIFIVALSLVYAYRRFGLPASVAIHFFQNAVALSQSL
ncbi:MAG: lysostaphin resistance A-like protein [Pyrobaculum sp.]